MNDPREWARGKTAEELLGLSTQMAGAINQLAADPRLAQPYQTQQAQTRASWDDIKDDDVLDGKTFKQAFQALAQSATQRDYTQDYQIAYRMVSQEPQRARIFQKYGPEIQAELANLPGNMRTLAYIQQVADIVASRHLEELATERGREIAATMTGLPIRSDGTGSPAVAESDGLPTNYQDILSKKGITLEMVRGFCASNGMTTKQWFDSEKRMHAVGSA